MIVEISALSGRRRAAVPVRAVTVTTEVIVGAGVGDELLAAVDHPLAVDEVGLGLRGAGVRARARLGETEAGQRWSGDEVGQPGLLLLVGAERQDRVDAETDGCLERDAHRLVDAADLLDRDTEAGEVAVLARTAELLGRGEAEQPELAHLLHDVDREVVVLVPLRGVRRDLGLRELAHALPEASCSGDSSNDVTCPPGWYG